MAITREMIQAAREAGGAAPLRGNSDAEQASVDYWQRQISSGNADLSDVTAAVRRRRSNEARIAELEREREVTLSSSERRRATLQSTFQGANVEDFFPSAVEAGAGQMSRMGRGEALARAQALNPWLSGQLLDVFADAFVEYDDPQLALQEIRNGRGRAEYDRVFAGNRREDGTLRLSENEYLSTVQQYRNSLAFRNLDPSAFEQKYGQLIAGEVSANEFESRVRSIDTEIGLMGEDIRRAFAEASGISDFSREGVLATALDPDGVGRELLERRIDISQVRGTAARFGFDRSQERVEQLIQMTDIDLNTAREFYARAQGELRSLQRLQRIYRGPGTRGFTLEELEEARLAQEEEDLSNIRRLLRREQSSFSRTTGVVQQTQDNALSGLAARRRVR